MPQFKQPPAPPSIDVNSWNKKRELLSKKKPSGVTEAIKSFQDAYKKADWTAYKKISGYVIKADGLAGNAGPSVIKEFNMLRQTVAAQKASVESGPMSKLYKAAISLHKTAKEASKMFADAKYPKASKAAAEIAVDALFFSGEIKPDVMVKFWDDLLKESITELNGKIAYALTIKIGSCADKNIAFLANIGKQLKTDKKGAVEAFNKASDDNIARRTLVQVCARITMAELFNISSYPLAKAKKIQQDLSPWAMSHKKVTEDTLSETLFLVVSLLKDAKTLPDDVGPIKL
ncbi:hypothetical protein M2103_000964 [Ereboglobus sp. PH5-5]|uniref:hypothetical protein n=1 Tax=unclassified Ereboglobus TaxID=2626932 RepID=UPI00240772F0|nr:MULTISPECIES: hypothetical protein [unclassified Ereboglobus]MDF9826560.1 hypothetical protein [Ereboglobus sp. PH5-10]MDF9832750.1 hypothetical protein [Ereboglobus sp. PH5-5]